LKSVDFEKKLLKSCQVVGDPLQTSVGLWGLPSYPRDLIRTYCTATKMFSFCRP